MCKYFFKTLSILFAIYPEVGLLDDMVVPFLIFGGTSILFSVEVVPFCNYSNSAYKGFISTHLHPHLLFSGFVIVA